MIRQIRQLKKMGQQLCWLLFFCCANGVAITAQEFPLLTKDSSTVLQLLEHASTRSNPDSTRYFLEQAYEVARQLNFTAGIRKSLLDLSLLEQNEQNLSMALRYALQHLNSIDPQQEPEWYYESLLRVGSIYQDENLDANAKVYYQLALPLLPTDPTVAKSIDLYERLGLTYFKLNEVDSALIYYKNVVDIHQQQADTAGMVSAYQQIVKVHTAQKNYDQALFYNESIKELVKATGDRAALAVAYNNLGYTYSLLKEYEAAKSQFRKTEKICAQKAYVDLVDLYTNMGINYNNQGNAIEALQYLQKANRLLHRKKGKAQAKAYISNLIATVYLQSKDVYNALQYNKEAMRVAKEGGNARLLSECYKTAAEAHEDLYAYDIALDYYQKHLALQDSFLLVERLRQQELLQQQLSLEREEKRNSLLMAEKEVQELTIRQLKLEADTFRLESQAREDEIRLLKIKEENLITDQRNKALEEEKEQQALRLQAQNLRLKAQRLEVENKDRALSELRQAERVKALEQMNLERQNEVLKKDKDILTRDKQLLTQQQQLDRSELERQEQFQQFAYGFVALLFLILSLILAGLFYTRKANLKLARQNKQIEKQKAEIEKSHTEVEQERHKSEALLLNILPAEMAMELKEMGGATPRHYDKVTVMFTDFSGFTRIAESMSPQDLIEELNVCFRAFDQIIENHNLEKIKTMGDAYMCAGGIPVPNEGNPYDAVAAALEMLDYMDERYAEKQALGQEYWRMRIGIHTGQVVAGVVGLKRFAYDIWGDTVNLASRLESSGEDGKINISGATHEWIKQVFHCTYRGKIAIKNKAAVSMYFVERLPVSAKVDQHSA